MKYMKYSWKSGARAADNGERSADATLDLATGYASLTRKVWAAMTSGLASNGQ